MLLPQDAAGTRNLCRSEAHSGTNDPLAVAIDDVSR
jgi:hypothetical protein